MGIIVLEGYTSKEGLTVFTWGNRTGGVPVREEGCFNFMPSTVF